MALTRGSGVLLHPTSLPGPDGIGDLGEGAYRFLAWLQRAGQRYWQIMPLVPTGFGDSPYASPSAFALNPDLISLDLLRSAGLLSEEEHRGEPLPATPAQFEVARAHKQAALRSAFERLRGSGDSVLAQRLAAFRGREAGWLEDYARFTAIKAAHGGAAWNDWPEPLARRDPAAMAQVEAEHGEEIAFQIFVQWVAREQWDGVRAYANARAIRIIGDIPIFVALDSADVWANPSAFRLDNQLRPTALAGVPPDYFSADGQLWGNPLYDWRALEARGFDWWVDRFRALLALVDVVRIDHFRAFAANWSVPAGAKTAAGGCWERGPGARLFEAVRRQLGEVDIIVEDLGLITPDVTALRRELGLPGMAVLQFAFDGNPLHQYLPHMYERQSVVYTGTHDNQTTVGWFWSQPERVRDQVRGYVGSPLHDPAWELLRLAENSVAQLAIAPMQDILRLGDEARMNTPGKGEGNWSWRLTWEQLDSGLADGLALITHLAGRSTEPKEQTDFDPFDYTAEGTQNPLHDPTLE